MIGRQAPRLDGPEIPRKLRAGLDECALVFDLVDAARKPGVMVDVGAHFGSSLASFARSGWKVLAFEPDSANRERLEANMAASPQNYAGVWLSPLAVSDEVRENVAFFSSPVSTGISGLSAFHESHNETGRVSTTTLNNVVREHELAAIDFLKIDVEGHEMSVLSGLDFHSIRPRVIIAEFEDTKTLPNGYSTGELAQYLVDRGYSVFASEWYPIERYGVRHQWRRILRWPTEIPADAWGNFIAFADPPSEEVLNAGLKRNISYPQSEFSKLLGQVRRFTMMR